MAIPAGRWPPTTPGRAQSIATTASHLTPRPRPTSSGCCGSTRARPIQASSSLLEESPIELGRHNKIALRQAIDLVRVDYGIDPSPSQAKIGMMAFGFGDGSGAVHEIEGLFEIGKHIRLVEAPA